MSTLKTLKMLKIALGLVFASVLAFAQAPTPTRVSPDCGPFYYTLTSVTTTAAITNKVPACSLWTMAYVSNGFSAVSIRFESAPDSSGSAGTFVIFAGTTVTGTNPSTDIHQEQATFTGFYPWVRSNLTSKTGTGTVNVVIYGYRQSAASIGGGGGGGGSGTVDAGIISQLAYYAATGTTVDPTGTTLIFSPVDLGTPAAPTLATAGTAGTTHYSYSLVRKNLVGGSIGSADATITTGNATLTNTNKINITPPACTGNQTAWDVYRSASAGTPATTGLIVSGSLCGVALSDTGRAVILPFTFAPSSANSIGLGMSTPLVNTSTGSAFGSLAFANNDVLFPFNDSGTGFSVLQNTAASTFDNIAMLVYLVVDDADSFVIGQAVDVDLRTANASRDVEAALFQVMDNGFGTRSSIGFIVKNSFSGTVTRDIKGISVFNNAATLSGVSAGDGVYGVFINRPNFTSAEHNWGVYVSPPNAGTVRTQNIAFFNLNMTGVAGVGKDFAWYSEGGTNHLETGKANTIGLEIEKFTAQTANLFQTVDTDGTTVLMFIDSDSRYNNRVIAFAALGTPTSKQQVYCSDCTVTSAIDNTCAGAGGGAMAFRVAGAWKCFV